MEFAGKWESEHGIDVELFGPFGSDDYRITWEEEGEETSESIAIYKSDAKLPLLAGSKLFGRCQINILTDDEIIIGTTRFKRKSANA